MYTAEEYWKYKHIHQTFPLTLTSTLSFCLYIYLLFLIDIESNVCLIYTVLGVKHYVLKLHKWKCRKVHI
jgi:hypothetical protein